MTFTLDRSLPILARTPQVVRTLLADLPAEWTATNEGPDTWSPFNVVGHLIDNEITNWMPRARLILSDGADRTFQPFDRFRHLTATKGRALADLLDEFARLREQNLAALRALNVQPADYAKTATHPALGTVTLGQLLATWVVHDLAHIGQVVRVMAKQYDAAVGPWKEYLPVLRPRSGGAA